MNWELLLLFKLLLCSGELLVKTYHCTHAPIHAQPSLPITPRPILTPPNIAISGLHYTAALHTIFSERYQGVQGKSQIPLLVLPCHSIGGQQPSICAK